MRRRLLASIAAFPLLVIVGLAAAGIASAGGGCHGPGAVTSAASSSVVKIDGCTFLPTINQVPVGASLTFLNSGMGPHDVSGSSGTWGSATLEPGRSYAHKFTTAGIYPYSCSLHPGMAGVVVVGPTDMALASDVQVAPVQPAAAVAGGSPVPVAVAAGAGLLLGAFGAGLLLRRRVGTE